ncbi:hypothetical protein ACEPAG_4378 [Sanghuangporus baumii]
MIVSTSKRKRFAQAARRAAIKLSKEQGKPITLASLARTQAAPSTQSHGPSEIIPRLYLGDYWDACNEAQLRSLGVTHILSLLETSPPFAFAEEYRASLKTMHVPLRDNFRTDIANHLDRTTEFIQKALKDPSSVVLVHCLQGVSRSPAVIAGYLLTTSTDFNSAESVLNFLKEKRYIVSPNLAFVSQLNDYATICRERRGSKPIRSLV